MWSGCGKSIATARAANTSGEEVIAGGQPVFHFIIRSGRHCSVNACTCVDGRDPGHFYPGILGFFMLSVYMQALLPGDVCVLISDPLVAL
jgi:hypothetical protein